MSLCVCELYVSFLAVIDALVFFLELLKAACLSQNSAAFAGVKRVARRAYTYTDFLHSGACHEGVSASASNFAILIIWVNVFLHVV